MIANFINYGIRVDPNYSTYMFSVKFTVRYNNVSLRKPEWNFNLSTLRFIRAPGYKKASVPFAFRTLGDHLDFVCCIDLKIRLSHLWDVNFFPWIETSKKESKSLIVLACAWHAKEQMDFIFSIVLAVFKNILV